MNADESNFLTGQHIIVDNGMSNILAMEKIQLDPPVSVAKAKL